MQELCDWLAKYNCNDVCMESTGKYWIPVFNVLEKNNIWVTLSHPKYTKPQKGNKTDRKDAKWICDLYMCGMVKPSFIPPAVIRELRDLVRDKLFISPVLTEVSDKGEFVDLELLVFWGMGIIKGPLPKGDVSAYEVDQPAVLLVKVLNK